MLRKFFYSLAAVVAVSTSAFAGVMGLSTAVSPPFTTETTLTGHFGYILSVMSDDNSVISAVDVNIGGQLHQRWSFNADTETFDATPSSANITSGDSHLNPIAGALVGSALTENNNVSASPLADSSARDYGYGNSLRGAWGIAGPSQTNKANIGYIVIPAGTVPTTTISAQVATANGTFTVTNFNLLEPGGSVQPVLVSNPVPGAGIELDFGLLPPGQNPSPLPIALSNSATGSAAITVSSITLSGPNAANFVLTGTLPTSLAGGAAAQSFGVDFGAPGQPAGTYNAVVNVVTGAGPLSFDVQATIPEPATLALAGLAVVGLVGFARRS